MNKNAIVEFKTEYYVEKVFRRFRRMDLEKIKKLAEKKADSQERRGTGAWHGIYHGFFLGWQDSEKSGLPIDSVSVSLFNEALNLMRDLAEHQNGAPLIRHEEECNKTITEVWDFLESNEA